MAAAQGTDRRADRGEADFDCACADVLSGFEPDTRAALRFGASALAKRVRQAADESADPLAPGLAAEAWLAQVFGRVDDALRRGALAAVGSRVRPDISPLPEAIQTLYPSAQARLARFLHGRHRYDLDHFAKDMALVAGVAIPAGALTAFLPEGRTVQSRPKRLRRAAGAAWRWFVRAGPVAGCHWLFAWGCDPWLELHVDTRNLHEFTREGLLACYRRLAGVLERRPDIAGVYAAGWLSDPALEHVSPELAFARRTAEESRGRNLRLGPSAIQTACAIARSPARRALVESGAYRPLCYAVFWSRRDLIAWAREERTLRRD